VEVTGCQVRTVGGVVQALSTEGGNMVDCCCCHMGFRIVMQKDDSCCEKARSLPFNGIFQSCQCLAVVFGIDGSPLLLSPSSLQKIQQKNPFSIRKHSQKHLACGGGCLELLLDGGCRMLPCHGGGLGLGGEIMDPALIGSPSVS
jgi:hypothetical protein